MQQTGGLGFGEDVGDCGMLFKVVSKKKKPFLGDDVSHYPPGRWHKKKRWTQVHAFF